MRARILTIATLALALSACAASERSPQTKVAECRLFGGRVVGDLTIVGQPGDQVNLEVRCGGNLVTNCIAKVPPRGTTDSCTLGPVSLKQELGAYLCDASVQMGTPTSEFRCRFI